MYSKLFGDNRNSSIEKNVFYHISRSRHISKPKLEELLNIKHTTLVRIINSLIKKGLVIQTLTGESAMGRKPKLLSVNPVAFYFIGIDLSRTYINIVLADACLRIICSCGFDMYDGMTPVDVFEKINDDIKNIINSYKIDEAKVLSIGVGTVGKVDKENGIILHADNFNTEWHNVPVKDLLKKILDIPIIIENGANAATLAEFKLGSARTFKNILFVNIGIGIRCGIINDGRIITNINDIDTSYSHILIEAGGKKCTCGNYGCLKAYSTIKPIIDEFSKRYKISGGSLNKPIDSIHLSDILEYANSDYQLAVDVLTDAANYMGIGLANLINILNPEIVILGGPLVQGSSIYYEKTVESAKSKIFKINERKIEFSKAHFDKESISIGMCAIVMDKYFSGI